MLTCVYTKNQLRSKHQTSSAVFHSVLILYLVIIIILLSGHADAESTLHPNMFINPENIKISRLQDKANTEVTITCETTSNDKEKAEKIVSIKMLRKSHNNNFIDMFLVDENNNVNETLGVYSGNSKYKINALISEKKKGDALMFIEF